MDKKHSKFGIASTLLALGIWLYVGISAFIFIKIDESGNSQIFGSLSTLILSAFILFLVLPIIGHILGIILGIVGCFSKTRIRVFGVIGLILNVLPFVLGLTLFLFG